MEVLGREFHKFFLLLLIHLYFSSDEEEEGYKSQASPSGIGGTVDTIAVLDDNIHQMREDMANLKSEAFSEYKVLEQKVIFQCHSWIRT